MTRQEFSQFLLKLQTDLEEHPEHWENRTLFDFLEAMSRYTLDVEWYYKNTRQTVNADEPSWQIFVDIMLGAKIYE